MFGEAKERRSSRWKREGGISHVSVFVFCFFLSF